MKAAFQIGILLCCLVSSGFSCSWAIGYFNQVSQLKGRVVGKDLKAVPFLPYWAWFRHQFAVKNARLDLYEYKFPFNDWRELKRVAQVTAGSNGRFDFGSLATGHYILTVVGGNLSDEFDVEALPARTKPQQVLIDISPVYPDCQGGHNFIVSND
jgi:hypothetical protein